MTAAKQQFHYHEDGSHNEKWFYLCRDTVSGRVYIESKYVTAKGKTEIKEFEIDEFLSAENGTATQKFKDLIGTLIAKET